MNRDKWRVKKINDPGLLYPWHAIPPGIPTPETFEDALEHYDDNRLDVFESHADALTYANL